MTYLQHINYHPAATHLSAEEEKYLQNHFDATSTEMLMEGQPVAWQAIEEVEVVVAPHAVGLAGWIVKNVIQRGATRYHVGVYFGKQEAVLPNITWEQAKYVVQTIAYYAPNQVQYTGPEDLVPLTER